MFILSPTLLDHIHWTLKSQNSCSRLITFLISSSRLLIEHANLDGYFGTYPKDYFIKCQAKTSIFGYQIVITWVDGNAGRSNLCCRIEAFLVSLILS